MIEIGRLHLTHGGCLWGVFWRDAWAIHDLLLVALIKVWWCSRKARDDEHG